MFMCIIIREISYYVNRFNVNISLRKRTHRNTPEPSPYSKIPKMNGQVTEKPPPRA